MDRKVEISEIFYSLEGEAIHSGIPTVYVRFSRCNKKCPLWNNPLNLRDAKGYAELGFDPKDYDNIKSMPIITRGCDSQYSVNPDFAHLWKEMTATEIMEEVLNVLPTKSLINKNSYQPIILSLTGGEPTLFMKFIVGELIKTPQMSKWGGGDCEHLLFETNCSVPLKNEHMRDLYHWAFMNRVKITWSNSPKLSDSGESWRSSIKPAVALAQRQYAEYYKVDMTQYFKFVHDGSDLATAEVKKAMNEYYEAGIPRNVDVALMPAACTAEQQVEIQKRVADICMHEGFRFSIRLQNILWGNTVGT